MVSAGSILSTNQLAGSFAPLNSAPGILIFTLRINEYFGEPCSFFILSLISAIAPDSFELLLRSSKV